MNSTKEKENHYYTLRVAETCSSEEIKESVRRLEAMLRDGSLRRRRQKHSKQIAEAYRVLSDPAKRREYDKQLATTRAAQSPTSSPENLLWPEGLPPWIVPHPPPFPGRHTPRRLPRPSRPSTPSPERPPPDLPAPPRTDAYPWIAVITVVVLMFVAPVVLIHYYYFGLIWISRVVCGYVGGIGLWAFLVAPIAIAARLFLTFGVFGGAALIAADNRLVRTCGYISAAAFGFFNTTIVASLVMLGHI